MTTTPSLPQAVLTAKALKAVVVEAFVSTNQCTREFAESMYSDQRPAFEALALALSRMGGESVAAGWAMVPLAPTPIMVERALYANVRGDIQVGEACAIYNAMLAAAPTAPAQQAAPKVACDGDHEGPPCADPECWTRFNAWGELHLSPEARRLNCLVLEAHFLSKESAGMDAAALRKVLAKCVPHLRHLAAERTRSERQPKTREAGCLMCGTCAATGERVEAPGQQEADVQGERTPLQQYDREHQPGYRDGWNDGRLYGYEVGKRHATERAAALAASAPTVGGDVPPELDVRKIMLSIVPGDDGMGHEVYAKSVDEVVNELSKLGECLEEWELGIRRLAAQEPSAAAEPVGTVYVAGWNARDGFTLAGALDRNRVKEGDKLYLAPPTLPSAPAGAGEGDSYEDIWNALQRIEAAAVSLPWFRVVHEGGIEACAKNIVLAIVSAPPSHEGEDARDAARDVLAERKRQITAEGWTPAHDDAHKAGELSSAAACYVLNAATWLRHKQASRSDYRGLSPINWTNWPWAEKWWKPKSERVDLVRAGALILAEIERLDRAARAGGSQ